MYKFYIVNLDNGVVQGTNNFYVARDCVVSDQYVVINTSINIVELPDDGYETISEA